MKSSALGIYLAASAIAILVNTPSIAGSRSYLKGAVDSYNSARSTTSLGLFGENSTVTHTLQIRNLDAVKTQPGAYILSNPTVIKSSEHSLGNDSLAHFIIAFPIVMPNENHKLIDYLISIRTIPPLDYKKSGLDLVSSFPGLLELSFEKTSGWKAKGDLSEGMALAKAEESLEYDTSTKHTYLRPLLVSSPYLEKHEFDFEFHQQGKQKLPLGLVTVFGEISCPKEWAKTGKVIVQPYMFFKKYTGSDPTKDKEAALTEVEVSFTLTLSEATDIDVYLHSQHFPTHITTELKNYSEEAFLSSEKK